VWLINQAGSLRRLTALKRSLDPDNVFCHNVSVSLDHDG
jgi:FAD/FMN-containing dehydrogenase